MINSIGHSFLPLTISKCSTHYRLGKEDGRYNHGVYFSNKKSLLTLFLEVVDDQCLLLNREEENLAPVLRDIVARCGEGKKLRHTAIYQEVAANVPGE